MSFFGFKSSRPKEPSKLRYSIKADGDEAASSVSSVSPTAPTSLKGARVEAPSIVVSEIPSEMLTFPRRTMREGRDSGELRAEKEVRGFAEDDIPADDDRKVSSTSAVPFISHKAGPGISTSTFPTSTSNHHLVTTITASTKEGFN